MDYGLAFSFLQILECVEEDGALLYIISGYKIVMQFCLLSFNLLMLEVLTLSTPIKDGIIKHNKDILNFYLTKSGHFYSRRDWGGGGVDVEIQISRRS